MIVDALHIWDAWQHGLTGNHDYVGEAAPTTRVTVEPDWWLNVSGNNVGGALGSLKKGMDPIRWFQDSRNNQTEIEIPQVAIRNVNISQSVNEDAASLDMEIINSGGFNKAGTLFFGHGSSSEAKGRWGQKENIWKGVLAPGTLVRVYTGFGGKNKTLEDAVADGNLVLYGVFILDEIKGRTTLSVSGRDMSALLIDQMMYPPLVPEHMYPVEYHRWSYETRTVAPTYPVSSVTRATMSYHDSGSDHWNIAYGGNGNNAKVLGHRPSEALASAGDASKHSVSVGNSAPNAPWAKDWIDFKVSGEITEVRVGAWGTDTTCWISVYENGGWQGTNLIPYSADTIIATQTPGISTHANKPYVAKTTIRGSGFGGPRRAPTVVTLPRSFNAKYIRITMRAATYTQSGPWHYRSGMYGVSAWKKGLAPGPRWQSVTPHPSGYGYWALRSDGRVEAFGDARNYGNMNVNSGAAANDIEYCVVYNQPGYAILTSDGHIRVFYEDGPRAGKTDHFPSQKVNSFGDSCGHLLLFNNYKSYYVVDLLGGVFKSGSGGTTVANINPSYVVMGASTSSDGKAFWAVDSDGTVYVRGTAQHKGDPRSNADFERTRKEFRGGTEILGTPDKQGYFIVDQMGKMYYFGSASNYQYGGVETIRPNEPAVARGVDVTPIVGCAMLSPVDPYNEVDGYAMLDTAGHLYGFGNFALGSAHNLGEPAGGNATMRSTGNYEDWTEIVRDILLWAGFWFKEEVVEGYPSVFGALESTGSYSEDNLTEQFFNDKAPIDVIKEIRDVVGYTSFTRHDGGFIFSSPNWWEAGNFLPDGTHTDLIPDVADDVIMTDWSPTYTKQFDRSELIGTSDEPTQNLDGTITSRFEPYGGWLHGMVVPGMFETPLHVKKQDQETMVELTALQLWFRRHSGEVTFLANPCLGVDDQIRILEETTSETYYHYIHSVRFSHDLQGGSYTMTASTFWLGDSGEWVVTKGNAGDRPQYASFTISEGLREWLNERKAERAVSGGDFSDVTYPELPYGDEDYGPPGASRG